MRKYGEKFGRKNDFAGGSDGSVCLQCGRPRFNPWVGKIPWRKWQPTPVLSPHGWRSLEDCSPWGRKESAEWLHSLMERKEKRSKWWTLEHSNIHLEGTEKKWNSQKRLKRINQRGGGKPGECATQKTKIGSVSWRGERHQQLCQMLLIEKVEGWEMITRFNN